jgi:serine/threonine protein phosphatase PrpC
MTIADAPAAEDRKPRDDEIDVYGLTHPGKVRRANQDHFLLATIHKRVQIHLTSLTDRQRLPFGDERLAVIAMIADGVGGGEGGERASATALEIATRYVVSSMNCYYSADATEGPFIESLQEAAMRCHSGVLARAKADEAARSMATTLTLWMGVWPWFYLLQVGDSRYYLYRDGQLTQVSRDQTLAQDLVDQGVFSRAVGERSRFAHAERLRTMTSAKQVCEQLLQDALDGGGSDNITLIIGRAVPRDRPACGGYIPWRSSSWSLT